MGDDNNPSLKEILNNIIQTYYKTLKDTANLIGVEAKFAVKNSLHILILSMLLQSFLLMTWICVCGLILVYLISLQLGILYSLSIVTALNILTVIVIVATLLKLKKNVAFTATRRQLLQLPNIEDLSSEHAASTNTAS